MTVRWGVAGPGVIATQFAEGMRLVDDGEVVAVASRSIERANTYADRFGVASRYSDYRALADDPAVDIVYVATPHSRHESDTLLFVGAGKHVLCEKPFALNAKQATRMVEPLPPRLPRHRPSPHRRSHRRATPGRGRLRLPQASATRAPPLRPEPWRWFSA
jgi:hypothetical protein